MKPLSKEEFDKVYDEVYLSLSSKGMKNITVADAFVLIRCVMISVGRLEERIEQLERILH